MRKMTLEEFKEFLSDYWADGITENEISIYYEMYKIGRQSVRW